eukprot:scaffold15616_cov14-Tisochrysis_lutea.AAC.2
MPLCPPSEYQIRLLICSSSCRNQACCHYASPRITFPPFTSLLIQQATDSVSDVQQQQEVKLAAYSLEMAKLRAQLAAAENARDQQLAAQDMESQRL